MTKKIYHLSHCTTCQRILSELNTKKCELIDIKLNPISESTLDHMAQLAGSYEALFSRRAVKYTTLGLKDKHLTEKQKRKYILEDYTFLKRPVAIVDDKIFIGNTKAVVEALKSALK